jgi:hypothetical protein
MNPGSPNVPTSVYRDDADGLNRMEGLRRQRSQLQYSNRPQPLSEFQMLMAGSVGRIVPTYGADLFVELPDTFGAAPSRNFGLFDWPWRRVADPRRLTEINFAELEQHSLRHTN